MTITARIIEACKASKGLTVKELAEATGETKPVVNTLAGLLSRNDRLFKAGVSMHYRYFTHEADAKAWELIAEDVRKEEAKAAAELSAARRRERVKKYAEAKRQGIKIERAPKKPKEPKPPKKPKRAELVLRRSEKAVAPAKPTKIIWPADLVIYQHPTPPSRFAFEPPEGWKGQISADWMDRRLQDVQERMAA